MSKKQLLAYVQNFVSLEDDEAEQFVSSFEEIKVKKGQIVEATEKFFAPNAKTIDFDGTVTKDKSEMLNKMRGFTDAMAKVNGITLHNASLNEDVSFAEFTFDFDMKDGSKIFWHEIIRTIWQNGQVIEEQYFNA